MTDSSQTQTDAIPQTIETVPELLAHAYALELDAVARYTELAAQMEVHNNPELAIIFAKLAEIERKHADQIADRSRGIDLPRLSPWEYQWAGFESPEAADASRAHYMMTPWHALVLALQGEEAALGFYTHLATTVDNPDVRALAREFAEEEREHVQLMQDWLGRYPPPEKGWDEDPDPPVWQE